MKSRKVSHIIFTLDFLDIWLDEETGLLWQRVPGGWLVVEGGEGELAGAPVFIPFSKEFSELRFEE